MISTIVTFCDLYIKLVGETIKNGCKLSNDYSVSKAFTFTTILFGIIGMTIGVVLAMQNGVS